MKNFYGLRDTFPHRDRASQQFEAKRISGRAVKCLVLAMAALFILFNTNSFLLGAKIEGIEIITFAPGIDQEPLLEAVDFCVTDDELFVIPDMEAVNIKIYEKNGEFLKLLKITGQRGYGADEFIRPAFCSYYKEANRFAVMDFWVRKIFIYDRIGRIDLKRVQELSCLGRGFDIQLMSNKVFISGHIDSSNNEPFGFYHIDLTNNQTTLLLPSCRKYGLNSTKEFEIEYMGKQVLPAIRLKGFFDIDKDYAYYIWEGNLKVLKININTGEISSNFSSQKSIHYVKPFASQKLFESYKTMNIKEVETEKAKMSYIKDIFATSKWIMVIYEGPLDPVSGPNSRIQFYTLDGVFIKEETIPGQPDHRMWFDKGRSILYSLSREEGKTGQYFISKYKIEFPTVKTKKEASFQK